MNSSHLLHVGPDEVPARLDVFLSGHLGVSRAHARRLLSDGTVTLNGRTATEKDKGASLAAGDRVEVTAFTLPDEMRVVPQPELDVPVLAEGDGWLVVDKPAGMPVHPLLQDEQGTVLNAVVARYPEIEGVGDAGLRSGVVHRLDVDTSGTLALATSQPTWEHLRQAFRQHTVWKTYRAIVLGRLDGTGREELDLIIGQHRPARVRVATPSDPAGDVRRCSLTWRSLEPLRDATLVEVDLETGFLHQVRVTFAHLGHPLLGDRHYGPASGSPSAPRHMLHASHLRIDPLHAHSPDPPDFARTLLVLCTR